MVNLRHAHFQSRIMFLYTVCDVSCHLVAEVKRSVLNAPHTFGALSLSISFSSGVSINGAHAVARSLCRLAPKGSATCLYGNTNLEKAEVDHWLEYSLTTLQSQAAMDGALKHLDSVLAPRVYLVGYDLTLADLAIYSVVQGEVGVA